jgi:hypothetical protein
MSLQWLLDAGFFTTSSQTCMMQLGEGCSALLLQYNNVDRGFRATHWLMTLGPWSSLDCDLPFLT